MSYHSSGVDNLHKVVPSIRILARHRMVVVATSSFTCRATCATSAFEYGL
jgi:hypothetical protein